MGLSLDEAVDSMCDQYKALYGAEKLKLPEVISSWGKHAHSYLYADNMPVLIMRYEDLKRDPEQQFSSFLEYAGVTVDADRVRKAIEITDISRLRAQEDEKGFREASELSKGFFGRKHEKPRVSFTHRGRCPWVVVHEVLFAKALTREKSSEV